MAARPEEGQPGPFWEDSLFDFLPCVRVQELISLDEQRGSTEYCCSGAEEPVRVASKGSVLTPLGFGFEESFSGCSLKGHWEAEPWSLCEELSLTLLVGLICPPVHCFWLSQNAWELCPCFFLLPLQFYLAFRSAVLNLPNAATP